MHVWEYIINIILSYTHTVATLPPVNNRSQRYSDTCLHLYISTNRRFFVLRLAHVRNCDNINDIRL